MPCNKVGHQLRDISLYGNALIKWLGVYNQAGQRDPFSEGSTQDKLQIKQYLLVQNTIKM